MAVEWLTVDHILLYLKSAALTVTFKTSMSDEFFDGDDDDDDKSVCVVVILAVAIARDDFVYVLNADSMPNSFRPSQHNWVLSSLVRCYHAQSLSPSVIITPKAVTDFINSRRVWNAEST